ncbi:Putative serine/threonine-protein kinase GCN2 [Glycine soja]|uniref:Putative serine/threonine-protein kinase GCN2 n=1 Tax=Glycine soja TaxID=3848 RepID=A0A0B2PAH5_GLYSO|nr:Putative serine/threonine-protein kinase GCN2 [Glycine soja]
MAQLEEGRRSKGRTQSKDHASQFGADDYDQLSEDITALCAIFEEDCKVLPGSPPRVVIKLSGSFVAASSITVSFCFLLGACLGIPSSAPSCRLLRRKGYQKLMLKSFCRSSKIWSYSSAVVNW